MNETINTITQTAAEAAIEAKDTIVETVAFVGEKGGLIAKSGVFSRMIGTTTGKVAVGVVAVTAVAAAGHYGWKKLQSYKAEKKAKAFCKKAAEEVKKTAEAAAE